MLRLFGTAGLLVMISAGLALATRAPFFRAATVVLGGLMVLTYVWLLRSVPRRRGELRIAGLLEPVEVYRDDRGIPHIYARNLYDLYLAQGYVTADDRLWTMDLNRRLAAGRMAEVFGPALLPLDRHFRTLGLGRLGAESLPAHSDSARACLEAYAAGVNARIREGRLPPEFGLMRYRPHPWTPADTLALVKYMAYDLGGNWPGELLRARMVQTVGAEKSAELFSAEPEMDLLVDLESMPLPDMDSLLEIAATTVTETVPCNSWVAAGSRTKSGAPMLATDPRLAVRNPAIWYQAHLVGPGGLDVIGATLPGIPGVVLGQNRHIAWGGIRNNPDVQDVYIERVHPERPDHFQFQGRWEPAARIAEEIRVRGSRRSVVHEVLVTRHGPVIARDERLALSLRWTALEPTFDCEAYLEMNKAQNWTEFRRALQRFGGPAQHFLCACRDGTIASRMAGALPQRLRGDGQAPVPGWSGEYEWTGLVPFESLPEVVNPPEGYIDSIPERRKSIGKLTGERMLQLQRDSADPRMHAIREMLLHAVEDGLRQGPHPEVLSPLEKQALLILSGWHGAEEAATPAPLLWHQWHLFVMEGIFRPQMGLALFDQFMACGDPIRITEMLVRRVTQGSVSAWLTREGEGSLPRIALRSFRRTVALLAAKQGRAPERWQWGREHKVRFEHPLALRARWLRPFLSPGPFPVGGNGTTVSGLGFRSLNPFDVWIAATWRQVVDLALPEESLDVCAPGQSGHPLSSHTSDQLIPWLKGELQQRLFRHDKIRQLPRLLMQPGTGK